MSKRVFLMLRTGDGTGKTPFQPNVPDGVDWLGYTIGTKFLVSTTSDLSDYGTELTSATALSMATALYGITVDHLDYTAGDPVSFMSACSQITQVAAHAIYHYVSTLFS